MCVCHLLCFSPLCTRTTRITVCCLSPGSARFLTRCHAPPVDDLGFGLKKKARLALWTALCSDADNTCAWGEQKKAKKVDSDAALDDDAAGDAAAGEDDGLGDLGLKKKVRGCAAARRSQQSDILSLCRRRRRPAR